MAGVGIGGYMLWPAITGTITGNKYYTSKEAQDLYDQGYADGSKSENELTAKVDYYKTLVDEYYIQVDTLTKQATILQNENLQYSAQISSLIAQKKSLETQLSTLKNESIQDKTKITLLETQIDDLNSEIARLELTIFNNEVKIDEYEDKILKLQTTVSYYEKYIANLETESQVVATFEFNGSVYNVQILNKGGTVMVPDPTSTEYIIFNGWTVNGEIVDLNTYTINTNTKFVADVSYKFTVKFSVDSTIISTQIVAKNLNATAPAEAPTKSGYVFKGWSVDGSNIVDVATYKITKDTKFIALFEKVYTVTFQYENEVVNTQIVERGAYAQNFAIEDTETKLFVGWTVNGELVDITNYAITSDTIFIAKVNYKYLVTFTANNEIYTTELVLSGTSPTAPSNTPTKVNQVFKGWSIDGTNVIDISTIIVSKDITLIAVFGNVVVSDFDLVKANVKYTTSSTNDTFTFNSSTLGNYDMRTISTIRVTFDYNYDFITSTSNMAQGNGVGSGRITIDISVNWDGTLDYAYKNHSSVKLFDYTSSDGGTLGYTIASSGDYGLSSFFETYNSNNGTIYIFAETQKIGFNFGGLQKVTKPFGLSTKTVGYVYISNISNVSIELIP